MLKFQNHYVAENLDFEATCQEIAFVVPGAIRVRIGRKPLEEAGAFVFQLNETKVLISPKDPHIVQVIWSDEKQKQECFKLLRGMLVRTDRKEIVLTPLKQNVFNIPYPEPEDFRLLWCNEGTHYFSFDRYTQLKKDRDAITHYYTLLDFDSAEMRADLLYKSDVLPPSWKKHLEPLFKADTLRKLSKPRWIREFLVELRNLIWENSRRESL